MATVQQQPEIFDAKAAERFAALWAGFEAGNPSEAEAMGKGRALRRMVADRSLRVIDALELPEIKQALDDQLQPVRLPVPALATLQAENDELRNKLAEVVPEVTRLAEALTREMELTARLNARRQTPQSSRNVVGPIVSGVLFLAIAAKCVTGVIGFLGGAWHHASPANYGPASGRYDPFNDPSFKPPVYIPPDKFAEEIRRAWKPETLAPAKRKKKPQQP
jgi:hypothetical protein